MDMKHVIMIAMMVFVLATLFFMYRAGVFSSENIEQLKIAIFGEPVPEELKRENVAPALVTELQKRLAEQKRQEEELQQKRGVMDAEWQSLQKLGLELENKLKEVEKRLARLREAKSELIQEEASKFKKMDPKRAAQILEELENDKAIAILLNLKAQDRAKIFDEMEASRATVLTKELLDYSDL